MPKIKFFVIAILVRPFCVIKLFKKNMAQYNLKIKRVYDEIEEDDGMRILVDRLWPRGISKASAQIDIWLKDIAPSSELREWFGHDETKWEEFQTRYRKELGKKKDLFGSLCEKINSHDVTLVYAATEKRYNNATALKIFLADIC